MARDPEQDDLAAQALASSQPSGMGWRRAGCPFCALEGHDDGKRSLTSSQRGYYQCWRCGTKGWLDENFIPADYAEPAPIERWDPPEGFYPLWEGDGASALALDAARRYLRKRAPQDSWEELQIGACLRSAPGPQAGRIIIPALGADGQWRGWVGRDWTGRARLPYHYPPGMQTGKMFYQGERYLGEPSDLPVLVAEGAFDAIALRPHAAIACFGKPAIGTQKVNMLADAPRPVVLVLDGDAWREGQAVSQALRIYGQRAGFVRVPPGCDPEHVPLDELWAQALASLDEGMEEAA